MSLPRYERYKESGVEWLGEVPEHWDAKRFKRIFQEREARSVHGAELLLSVSAYTGVSPRSEMIDDGEHLSRAETLEGYKLCFKDDLVMNIMLAWNRGLAFTEYDGIVSPAYCVFFVIDGSKPKFLNYLVRSDEYTLYFKAFSSGVIDSRLRIYPDTFGRLFCSVPPLPEQHAIAGFLDRETAKIDALIAEQQRLIALLAEKRQATISHAVTKGLNPAAPMKGSGVEWLGDVPEHWDVRRLKSVSTFTTSGPRGWSERVGEEGHLFVQSGDLNDSLQINFANAKRVRVYDDAEASRTRLCGGDIVVCITGAKTGNVAVCTNVPEPAYVNQHLCLVRPNQDVRPVFLGVLLKSEIGQNHFELSQYGLKQGLSLENVREAPILLPPIDEQSFIVDFVETETAKLNTLTAEAQRAIALLQERRTALISAAVTGKIDVRSLTEREAA